MPLCKNCGKGKCFECSKRWCCWCWCGLGYPVPAGRHADDMHTVDDDMHTVDDDFDDSVFNDPIVHDPLAYYDVAEEFIENGKQMLIWKDRRPHKTKGRLETVVTVVSVASKDAAVSLGLPVVNDNESDGPAGRTDSSPPSPTPRRRVSSSSSSSGSE